MANLLGGQAQGYVVGQIFFDIMEVCPLWHHWNCMQAFTACQTELAGA